MRHLQRQQIHKLCLKRNYNSKVALDPLWYWHLSNLKLSNWRSAISHQPELLIHSDASKKGWGALCQKTSVRGFWSQAEQALHKNILELREAKFEIITLCRYKKDLAVHAQIDIQVALDYLVKMGGARNLLMIQVTKEIWEICFTNEITLTAEYLPETLNIRKDKNSEEMKNSSSK